MCTGPGALWGCPAVPVPGFAWPVLLVLAQQSGGSATAASAASGQVGITTPPCPRCGSDPVSVVRQDAGGSPRSRALASAPSGVVPAALGATACAQTFVDAANPLSDRAVEQSFSEPWSAHNVGEEIGRGCVVGDGRRGGSPHGDARGEAGLPGQ